MVDPPEGVGGGGGGARAGGHLKQCRNAGVQDRQVIGKTRSNNKGVRRWRGKGRR